jgi:hypothetical protein
MGVKDLTSLSCAIMHTSSSAERKQSLQQIMFQLYSQGSSNSWVSLEVMDDPFRQGVWFNAKRCWKSAGKATHHLVLQDDIVICNNFVNGIFKVIEAFPNDIISLFHGPRKNFDGSCRWGQSEGVWGQAIVMPTGIVQEFLNWEEDNIHPSFMHDDSRVSLFAINTGRRVKVPFPNLVNHRDTELKSVLGNKWSKPRVSSDFMGARDPFDFDWMEKDPMMSSINSFTQYNKYLLR